MRIPFLMVTLLLFTFFSNAQERKLKWGQVEKSAIDMSTYPKDSSANAVVLADFGHLRFDFSQGHPSVVYSYHKQIKILKRAGFDYADISIPYHREERISGFKAQVILPSKERINVKKNETFTEEVNDNWSRMKLSFPKIEEGAIIEYKYELHSENIFSLKDWYFQRSIPTIYSQFTAEIPEWYNYLKFNQGQKLSVNESQYVNGKIHFNTDMIQLQNLFLVMASENVPAIKEESYVTTLDDHISKVQFQLQSYRYPNGLYTPVLSDWVSLAKELHEHNHFGKQFNRKGQFDDILAEITPLLEAGQSQKDKAEMVYKFIGNNLEWDGSYSYMAAENLNQCYKLKKANSGELNLMLLAVLRKIGIEADPILVSTRSHGKMLQSYPMVNQFNHVMVVATLDGNMKLLDIGNPARPMGLPRKNALNYSGWLIKETNPQWVEILAPKSKTVKFVQLDWDEDQKLKGVIKSLYEGYDAVDFATQIEKSRRKASGSGTSEEKSRKEPTIVIDSVDIPDYSLPINSLKTKAYVQLPDNTQSNGDFLYIQPVIEPPFDENPFKVEERSYPVEIPYGFSYKQIVNIPIPKGYAVEEIPEQVSISLANGGGKAEFRISNADSKLQIIYAIDIDNLIFTPDEYKGLKKFFDLIIDKQQAFIVLRKKT